MSMKKGKIDKYCLNVKYFLRVLLDKPPDIVTPTVGGKFLFGYIINSTYPGGLPKVKSLDLGACTVLWGLDQVI